MTLIKLCEEKIKLQKHQKEAGKQLNKSKSLIANHGLGSGKTLTSIAIGEKHPNESKLVLAPAALLHNYRKELHKFNIPETNYHLISYEKFRKNPQSVIDKFKPSTIIADEFHRSKDSDTLIGESIRSVRPKVKRFIGLTGTIAQNHPSEIGELLHNATGYPVLGSNPKEFKQYFIHERKINPNFFGRLIGRKPGVIEEPKNLNKFKEIASKYIHTFSGDEEYKKHIPTIEHEIKRIQMDKPQQKIYDYTFGKAPKWVKYKIMHDLPPSKKELTNMNAFLIGARQASDSTQPWTTKFEVTPKIHAVVNDIREGLKNDKNFKAAIYSNFLGAGVSPLAKQLERAKIPYGSFTGQETNEQRNKMVHDYNKGRLKALLLSPAGGEGLDLKNTKLMGILDQSWNRSRTNQAIGRAARFKSHESLPEGQRKLKVIEYLSEPKLGLLGKIKKVFRPNMHAIGVDEYIYHRAKDKESLNRQFTDVLK